MSQILYGSQTEQPNQGLLANHLKGASGSAAAPAWNIHSEYPSITSNEFSLDMQHFDELVLKITEAINELRLPMSIMTTYAEFKARSADEQASFIAKLQSLSELQEQAGILLSNLFTFVNCEFCIDGTNADTQTMLAKINQLRAKMHSLITPLQIYIDQAPLEIIDLYLQHPHTAPQAYALHRSRERAFTRLSEAEENVLAKMRSHAITSLGTLYNQIAGNLLCQVTQADGTINEMGLAQTLGHLRDTNEMRRKAAWNGIQQAWHSQRLPAAAILNGLAGWRIEECSFRSKKKKIRFLDTPTHASGIQPETLEAMLTAVKQEGQTVGQRAMRAMAQAMQKPQLDPWDLLAGCPMTSNPAAAGNANDQSTKLLPFKEGLRLIRDAFASIDPSMGDFVDMMEKNRWIEGRILNNKRQGAFCTTFEKSRTPRVFQSYLGSMDDVRTLAHELGHAYHSWVMRDIAPAARHYAMTLAETASIFAETIFGEHLGNSGTSSRNALVELAWQEAESAGSFLLNIPARFEFEKSFYERREQVAFCSSEELNALMAAAWKKSYGNTLASYENQYWMTKLHFSMSEVSFYNFPYTFGALFSLNVYSHRQDLGPEFLKMYVDLLRDTGRMTCEDLAEKHLGEDITKPEFWTKSIRVIEKQITRFENLVRPPRLKQ